MEPRSFDVDLHLRQHGVALRRLAHELLHDPADVDDALQETWLRALQAPPRHETHLGSWLATILKHTIGRTRRSERRRTAREQLAARPDVAADHVDTRLRAEAARDLLAAVQRLETPFRDAVWQRYFEDKPPREIAARAGVPLATVKSRLRRGLQQLRERLGEGGESSDWRCALALAFGFEMPKGAAAAGTAVAIAGGVGMAAWMKVAAAAVAAGVVLWWTWPASWSPVASGATPRDAAAVASRGTTARRFAEQHANHDSMAVSREAAPLRAAPTPGASLRGRCVDTHGNPLAGCTVKLDGVPRGSEADAWLRDHPSPGWRDMENTTAADGVFAFRFDPPPPFEFRVAVRHADRCSLNARWLQVGATQQIDVGDIELRPGVQLTGLLVDDQGRPLAKNRLYAMARDPARATEDGFAPALGDSTVTGGDGRFGFPVRFVPGAYRITGANQEALGEVHLPADRTAVDVHLVAHRKRDASTISGRVVDDLGSPIAGTRVHCRAGNRATDATSSRGDGSFELHRPHDSPDAVTVTAQLAGFEPTSLATPVAWGNNDIEIVLLRAAHIAVRVTDTGGLPVEHYTVRVLPRGSNATSSDTFTVRARGPFTNGTATIRGITSGAWTVMVEFPSASCLPMLLVPLDVAPGIDGRLDLLAEPPVKRSVRVVDDTGTPVAGSRVRVCDLIDGVFDADTLALPDESLFRFMGSQRARIHETGVTDGQGRTVLRGSAGRAVGLELLGPGHIPVRLAGVRLDQPGELEVNVAVGARLQGRIVPAEAMDELRRLQGHPAATWAESQEPPSIELARRRADTFECQPERDEEARFFVDEKGRFDIGDLKPGEWTLSLRHTRALKNGWSRSAFEVTTVALRAGTKTHLDLDLSAILPGTLEGTVRHNGEVLADSDVLLECSVAIVGSSDFRRESYLVHTDATGSLSFEGRPGAYRAKVLSGEPPFAVPLLSDSSVEVVRGRTSRHAFAIWSGSTQIRLRDDTGSPAAGVDLRLEDSQGRGIGRLSPTDREGRVRCDLPVGSMTVLTLPRRLQSPEAQAAVRKQAVAGTTDPFAPFRMTLGTVTVRAGETTAIDLHLPPEWRQ